MLFAAHATAQTFTDWTPVYQGIDYATLTETGSNPQQMYAMRIDLDASGISFVTTPTSTLAQSEGGETISQTTGAFMQSVGAQVAINANFFSNVSATPQPETLSGLAMSDGSIVAPLDSNFQSLMITANNVATIGASTTSGIFNAVSGVQDLVNGVAVTPNSTAGDPTGLDPRSEVGISQSGQYLYLLAIDGRSSTASGVTDQQAGQILSSLGAYNGLNLDGGGSTALVDSTSSGGVNVLNNPSGGTQRLDGNNLAIFATALTGTTTGGGGTGTTTPPVPGSGAYTTAVQNDHPALYYQMTETTGTVLTDSSGNNLNGTYPTKGTTLGQATTPVTSQPNTTVAFNGSAGTHATVAYNSAMSAGSFTIAAWADPTANYGAGGFGAVVSERNNKGSGAAGNAGFILYDGSVNGTANMAWQFWTGGNTSLTWNYEGRGQSGMGTGPTAQLNQWQFVVGTFQANGGPDANGRYTGTQDLYVNGQLVLSESNVQYLPDTTTPMYIGGGDNELSPGDGLNFNGDIGQVALFDSALSASQINALYLTATPEPKSYLALLVPAFALLVYVRRRKTISSATLT